MSERADDYNRSKRCHCLLGIISRINKIPDCLAKRGTFLSTTSRGHRRRFTASPCTHSVRVVAQHVPHRSAIRHFARTALLPAVRVLESIGVVSGILVTIEVRPCVNIRCDRISGQEPSDHRIVVALLHVAQPSGSIAHVPCVSRPISSLLAYNAAIGFIVIALDHVATFIGFGNDRAKCISVDVGDCLSSCDWDSDDQEDGR